MLEVESLTAERDAAVAREAETHRLMQETRTSLEAQTQNSSTLANQLELARSRENNLITEKDAAKANANSLQAQVVALQNKVLELENLAVTNEGIAVDMNSRLIISEFTRVCLRDDYGVLQQSVNALSNQRNQLTTDKQTLLVSMNQAQSDLKFSQEKAIADATDFRTKMSDLQDRLKNMEAKRVSDIASKIKQFQAAIKSEREGFRKNICYLNSREEQKLEAIAKQLVEKEQELSRIR